MSDMKVLTVGDRDCEYSVEFYDKIDREAHSSAEVVIPMLLELLELKSVVDVGCGRGVWLSVFNNFGIDETQGLDGPWVETCKLAIPKRCFHVTDLTTEWSLEQTFDLALCLEVTEHLPTAKSDDLIGRLTTLADAILFSAAIPGQEGTNHINEQWPEFWEARFERYGFVKLDPFRCRIWQDSRVAWYYQQNLFLYVNRSLINTSTQLQAEFARTQANLLTLVHPKILRPMKQLRPVLRLLPRLLLSAISRRMKRFLRSRNGSN